MTLTDYLLVLEPDSNILPQGLKLYAESYEDSCNALGVDPHTAEAAAMLHTVWRHQMGGVG